MKLAIESTDRSAAQENELLEYAIEICEDKIIQQWLRENSAAFFHLTDMFNLVRRHMDKEKDKKKKKKKEKKKEKVDIIFVAHGGIEDEKHPAAFLPWFNIEDVFLYSPWNCAIDASAAYGIATGLIQPQHRVFRCTSKDECRFPHEEHRPRELPPDWNSMRKAGFQLIPKIMVQSLQWPEDGAWEAYKYLADAHGEPDKSRIVIPFLIPGPYPLTVPFYVVTLALALALFFFGYEATVHLAACLCDDSEVKFDRRFLERQYSYTIDYSAMISSEDMFPVQYPDLYRAFQALFDHV